MDPTEVACDSASKGVKGYDGEDLMSKLISECIGC